jgi:putative transcriptional regulator
MTAAEGRSPTPAEIRAARAAAGLSQREAAELVWAKLRTWQHWEAGTRTMHPAIWWAFQRRNREKVKPHLP